MTHSHTNRWRPRRFRAFVTNQYYANRDEYNAVGQTQPYTFAEYVSNNISDLRLKFKKLKKEVDKLQD
jgi:hypothetical protein